MFFGGGKKQRGRMTRSPDTDQRQRKLSATLGSAMGTAAIARLQSDWRAYEAERDRALKLIVAPHILDEERRARKVLSAATGRAYNRFELARPINRRAQQAFSDGIGKSVAAVLGALRQIPRTAALEAMSETLAYEAGPICVEHLLCDKNGRLSKRLCEQFETDSPEQIADALSRPEWRAFVRPLMVYEANMDREWIRDKARASLEKVLAGTATRTRR
jgi:hypothetical protein